MSFSTTRNQDRRTTDPPENSGWPRDENATSIFGMRGNHRVPLSLNRHLYLRANLQANLVSLCIGKRVIDTEFLIEIVRTLHGDLCFIRFGRTSRLDQFLYRSGQSSARIFCHCPSL